MSYILQRTACEADLHRDDSFNEFTHFRVWPLPEEDGGAGGQTREGGQAGRGYIPVRPSKICQIKQWFPFTRFYLVYAGI